MKDITVKAAREIKFRAWDKYRNRLINDVLTVKIHRITNDPCLVVYTDKKIKYNSEIKESDKEYCNEFNLMQYTGLKDKDGTKIFEGDICEHIDKDNYPRPFAVEWIEDYACFAFVDKGDYSRNYYFQKSHMENIRVVGNIYNNKSLLK